MGKQTIITTTTTFTPSLVPGYHLVTSVRLDLADRVIYKSAPIQHLLFESLELLHEI